jgi:hypothetical protein
MRFRTKHRGQMDYYYKAIEVVLQRTQYWAEYDDETVKK